MSDPTHDYLHCALTAVVGGTFNLLAFLVSMQDIEQWLRISSLIVGNLVGVLTILKLVMAIRAIKANKPVDTDDP